MRFKVAGAALLLLSLSMTISFSARSDDGALNDETSVTDVSTTKAANNGRGGRGTVGLFCIDGEGNAFYWFNGSDEEARNAFNKCMAGMLSKESDVENDALKALMLPCEGDKFNLMLRVNLAKWLIQEASRNLPCCPALNRR